MVAQRGCRHRAALALAGRPAAGVPRASLRRPRPQRTPAHQPGTGPLMRVFRGILYVLIGLIAVAIVLTSLVVATTAGLRLALEVAEPYLPSALELGEVDGTLAGGVVLRGGAWRGEGVTVEVRELELELDPWPLIRRDVRLERLRALGVTVHIAEGRAEEAPPQGNGGRFRFRMPVPLAIEDGRLEDVRVSAPGWSRSARVIEVGAGMRCRRLDGRSEEHTSELQ